MNLQLPRLPLVSRLFVALLGAQLASAGAAAAGGETETSAAPVEFIDAATGLAIQPASVVVGSTPVDSRAGLAQWSAPGRGMLALPRGRHSLIVETPGYQPMSASVELGRETHLLRFVLEPEAPPAELLPEAIQARHRDGETVLLGYVGDDATGQPLAEVLVEALPSGRRARTDARGFFVIQAPVEEEASATLEFSKSGYQTQRREQLELWSRGDWTYRVRLARGEGSVIVDERGLRRRAPPAPAGAESPRPAEAPARSELEPPLAGAVIKPLAGGAVPTVRTPRNIRVLLSDNTTIEYVSFDYYCKHVLPAEWIAGWAGYAGGSNSLNAGAVAVRTYAIGYLNNPRGSTYDICATTSCQVYGSSTSTYSDTAVNFTADYVAVNSAGAIPSGLTEYSAENNQAGLACGDGFTAPSGGCLYDPVCSGEALYGHGRGMCQWGTARWATGNRMAGRKTSDTTPNGYPRRDWMWICRHYYPTLTLVKGAPLAVGDEVKALKALTLYQCADGGIGSGTGCPNIGTEAAGATGVIVAGPARVTAAGTGGFTWYQVQWTDGKLGWAAENYLDRALVPPPAVTGLTAAAAATNQINLAWADTAELAAGYRIERSSAPGSSWVQIGTTPAGVTNYSDRDLPLASRWYYRVRAWNPAGVSGYSPVAGASALNVPPQVAAIADRSVFAGAVVEFDAVATAPDDVFLITDFTPFLSETANGVVLFRHPRFSGSTSGFLSGTPALAAVTDTYPLAGHGTGMVLRVSCQYTNFNDPWLRLTTADTASLPNPVIDLTARLRFDIYADHPVRVAVGCRETSTLAGTPIGSDGGTSGAAIEWAGVTNKSGSAPLPTRLVNAGVWQTLTFDLAAEPIYNFTGGNGILSTPSGRGVLEHLALAPVNLTSNIQTVYLDNFAVVKPRRITWSLGVGAPAGAAIDPLTGAFHWIPGAAQAPSTNLITLVATDGSVPAQAASRSFTVIVQPSNHAPVLAAIPDRVAHAGSTIIWTNQASDPDSGQALVFSLDAGAASGAAVDPLTGVFSWATGAGLAGTTNRFTVRVTDSGQPTMTDAKSFQVALLPPPVAAVNAAGTNVMISWPTIPGTAYRLEYKDQLNADWVDAGIVLVADGPAVEFAEPSIQPQRFYRLVVK